MLNAREQITRTLTRRHARRAVARGPRLRAAPGPAQLGLPPPAAPGAGPVNVKLSPGGIRDIEFLAQCLQRLYGGEDPWLQAAPTLVALQRLHDKNHLSGRDFHRLAAAYEFLRIIEHRLQLRDGLQRHQLPEAAASLDRLARRCGIEAPSASAESRGPGGELTARLAGHLEAVREIYSRLLQRQRPEGAGPRPRAPIAEESAGAALARRLEEDFPALGAEAAQLIVGLESAHYLRRGLVRYLTSALLSPAVMARLEDDPGKLREAAALFERSDLAVDLLAHHPEQIEQIGAPADRPVEPMLPFPRSAVQRAEDLRSAYRVALFREIAAELLGPCAGPEPAPFPFLERLTALAEDALREALQMAVEETFGATAPEPASAPFAVLALGRMGSREMSIASDADLLFVVADGLSASERIEWRRTAEALVHIVSSHTREGVIFAVDTRLRPRGAEGELVPSEEALIAYLTAEAVPWEAVTFLKARPVAGNLALGARVAERAIAALRARYAGAAQTAEMARELARIRTKVEQDAAGPRTKGRLKKIPGGFYDLEYIIGYLTYARGLAPAGGNTLSQLHPLEAAGVLDPAHIEALRTTAVLYRAADHATRLITGRPLAG